jgi:crotonobetaine/carnitine-CoA ligase
MNIGSLLQSKVDQYPDKTFLFFDHDFLSYKQFNCQVNRSANALLELGIKRGDRVCLMLGNTPQFLYAWFGMAKIGAILVALNTSFKEKEARYIVSHSQARGVITNAEHLELIEKLKPQCSYLDWVACVDPVADGAGVISWRDLMDTMSDRLPAINVDDHDPAQIAYTSGTTGFPKGAVHSQRNFVLSGEAFTLCADLGPDDRVMAIMPLFHSNAQYYSVMGALAAGAGLVLIPRFSAGQFWNQAVEYQATEFNFIGAIGSILCRRPEKEFLPEHQIKTAYGALVTPEIYDVFQNRFGIRNVIDGYGLTEVTRVCQNPIHGQIKMGSIGLPAKHPDPDFPFSQVKILNQDGHQAGPGEHGEIMVKSPVMMQGYYRDPEATVMAIEDGWLHTGDIGYKDEDEYIFFVDRMKNIIRRKGENLSAAEVEAVINAHQAVSDSAVIAVPAEMGEDEIMAIVVLAPGKSLTPEELVDWCKPRLAHFKLPRFVLFRDSLPKTATSRVEKYLLKKEAGLVEASADMRSYLGEV